MAQRRATHAGSWYEENATKLDRQLSTWLAQVNPEQIPSAPRSVIDVGHLSNTTSAHIDMPIDGLKAVIAPHAGYSYSGPPAAWAYKCIDPTKYDRVFILGPSHHVYLDGCALSACNTYETPLGSLSIDKGTTDQLRKSGKFSRDMSLDTDEDEHSIEMHLPYIRKVFENHDIEIVPILVGSISTTKEDAFGNLLAPYLEDDRTLFVVSSDFCHWGTRFRYTYYKPSAEKPQRNLAAREQLDETEPSIHSSIRALDGEAIAHLTYPAHLPRPDARDYTGVGEMAAPSSNGNAPERSARDAQQAFASYIRATSNTICGRHPIGVLLGALAALEEKGKLSELHFTRYEQSSRCITVRDSSVSYASAFVRFT